MNSDSPLSNTGVAVLGYGRFGRALADLCAEAGAQVLALDPAVEIPAPRRAASVADLCAAPLVFVAVPVAALRQALRTLRPHLRAEHLVLDVGSVKVHPGEDCAAELGPAIPWVGTHPLFGPVSLALAEHPLRVVVCPNALHPAAAGRARAVYESLGCQVFEMDAAAHDWHMASTHALAFFVSKGMLDAGFGEETPISPPSFQGLARTLSAVRGDAGHLFRAIQQENPFSAAARQRLLAALEQVHQALAAEPEPPADASLGPLNPPDSAPRGEAPSLDREARSAAVIDREARSAAVIDREARSAAVIDREARSAAVIDREARSAAVIDPLRIPDLGTRSPELREVRELIDGVDRELLELLARRTELARRAARAKAQLGYQVRDPAREATLLQARREWAKERGLDPAEVEALFVRIVAYARRIQGQGAGGG